MHDISAFHNFFSEADTKPDANISLRAPSRDIVVSQSQNESDLLHATSIMCEIFHREAVREIH